MGMKNHKPGCKCVGCSPATRKRGQKALEEGRKEAKPKAKAKAKAKPKPKAETKPKPERPAAERKPKAKPKAERRSNPAQPEVKRVTPRVGPLENGRFYVVHLKDGSHVHGAIRQFPTKKAAEEYARTLSGGEARIFENVVRFT
ncbi:MAG: hypothetical protein HDKAJFGB_00866 [Anaerolineae bacterium]|nr:hypothetical protein [Anaerolineae bacterium]